MLNEPPCVDEMFLDVYLLLYDMLNDDEEELRDVAAVTASLLLSDPGSRRTQSLALHPMAAGFRMAEFLVENYASSSRILRETIRRLLGHPSGESNLVGVDMFISVSTLLFGHRKGSSVLFAEEKQNLFIDDVREARIWAEVLSQLVVADADIYLIQKVYSWTLDGLSSLTQMMQMEGTDGIFGRISHSEVFTIGIRVIQATSVLIHRDGFGGQFFDRDAARKGLEDMSEAGVNARIHECWLLLLESSGNR